MAKPELYERVLHFIITQRMFCETDRVLVAISGGPDSVALVALLSEIRERRWPALKLHLAHLNHQLRGQESERDEVFVRALAERLGLDLTVERLAVAEAARRAGQNLEEVARRLRYQFLQRAAEQAQAGSIATGHTMNDQAETVLMRLLRGAGAAGLAGIYPLVEPAGEGGGEPWMIYRVVRPLLGLKRDQIELYLEERALSACADSSNLELHLTRNKIRLEVLPRLLEINPRAIEAIARAAELLREEYAHPIDQPETRGGTQVLSVELLNDCLQGPRRRSIREAIGRVRGNLRRISAAHIEAVESLLTANKSGKRVPLPGGYEAAREFDALVIRPAAGSSVCKEEGLEEQEWQELPLGGLCRTDHFRLSFQPAGRAQIEALTEKAKFARLDLDRVGERLRVRTRRPGDRYRPFGHKRIEKLKNLMIENRIPLSQRSTWPVVITERGELVWSPGLPVAHAFAARVTTGRFAIILAEQCKPNLEL